MDPSGRETRRTAVTKGPVVFDQHPRRHLRPERYAYDGLRCGFFDDPRLETLAKSPANLREHAGSMTFRYPTLGTVIQSWAKTNPSLEQFRYPTLGTVIQSTNTRYGVKARFRYPTLGTVIQSDMTDADLCRLFRYPTLGTVIQSIGRRWRRTSTFRYPTLGTVIQSFNFNTSIQSTVPIPHPRNCDTISRRNIKV